MLKKLLVLFPGFFIIPVVLLLAQCPESNAGLDIEICVDDTATLNATLPASFYGYWRQVGEMDPLAVFADSTDPATSVTNLDDNNTISLVWAITDSVQCQDEDTVNIAVYSGPRARTSGSPVVCVGGTVELNASNVSAGSIGTWAVAQGEAAGISIADPNNPDSPVSGFAAADTVTFIWTVITPVCEDTAVDDQNVFVNENPTTAVAPADISICQGVDTVSLTGNEDLIGTAYWEVVSGGLVFAGSSQNDSVRVTGVEGGPAILVYYIENGNSEPASACVSSDTVLVSVTPSEADAGPDQGFCAGGGQVVDLAAGAVTAGETGTWKLISGTATISDPADPATQLTGIPVDEDTLHLRWVVTETATMCSDSDEVIIVYSAPPTPAEIEGGDSLTICEDASLTLVGSEPLTGIPSWSVIGGTNQGMLDMAGTDNDTLIAGTGDDEGYVTLMYMISIGTTDTASACVSWDTVQVYALNRPRADAGSSVTICGGTSVTLNADPLGAGETGVWSTTDTVDILEPANPATTVSGLEAGQYTMTWTVTDSLGCSDPDNVSITVNPLPTPADAGDDITICAGDTVRLTGSEPLAGSPSWNDVGTTNLVVISGNTNDTTFVTVTAPDTVSFVYTIGFSGGGFGGGSLPAECTSRDTVEILTLGPSVIDTITYEVTCAPANAIELSAEVSGYSEIQWTGGTGTFTSADALITSYVPSEAEITAGVAELILAVTNGPCETVTDTIIVESDFAICTGLNSARAASWLHVHPNPGTGVFNISFDKSGYQNAYLTVLTANGQIVREEYVSGTSSRVNLSNLPVGVYLLKVRTGDKTAFIRLLKN